jgi:hypothetical protein
MTIHLQDIETLLASYVKAHSTGSLKTSGSLIPGLFRALIAHVEEKIGGEPVPSTLDIKPVAPATERLPAPEIDLSFNPLGVIEDHFITQGVRPNGIVDVVEETFQAAQDEIVQQAAQETVQQTSEPTAPETAPEVPEAPVEAPETASGDETTEDTSETADEPKKPAAKKPAAKKG